MWFRCGLALLVLLLPPTGISTPTHSLPTSFSTSSVRLSVFATAAAAASRAGDEGTVPTDAGGSGAESGNGGDKKSQQKKKKKKKKRKTRGGGAAKRESGLVCDSTMGHRFNPVAPVHKARHNKMSFCSKYRRNTCCNKTHTDAILRKDRVVAAAKLNAQCRRISETMHCAPCDPDVGTGRVKRVCESLCNAWLQACGKEFYSAPRNVGGALMPCLDNMLVCSQLDTIVSNGAAFCRAMGFEPEVVKKGDKGGDDEDEDGDDDNSGKSQCFDGSVPQSNGVFEAENDTPGDLNDLFKRYRKSHAGKAASSLARALDTIPTWVLFVFTLLVGAFITFRVFVLTNSRRGGRRLGGGGGDGLSRFQNNEGRKGAQVKDDFDDVDSDGDEFFDAASGSGKSDEAGPTANSSNVAKAFPKVDNW